MILIQGWVRFAKAGEIDRLRAAATTMIEATLKESGCLEYAFAADVLDPSKMHVIERWRDDAALASHFQSPHMAAFNAALAAAESEAVSVKTYLGEFQRTLMGE